jgi:acyl-coenzyme A synthetase/AMP-(fatty) acid ligase
VFAVNLDGGAVSLGIALVLNAGADREQIRTSIAKGLKLGATTSARIVFLDALPKMGNGKVDRVALHRIFQAPPAGSL